MYEVDDEEGSRLTRSQVKEKFDTYGLGKDFEKIEEALDYFDKEYPKFVERVENSLNNGDTVMDLDKYKQVNDMFGVLEKYGTHAFWEQGNGHHIQGDEPVVFYVNGLDSLNGIRIELGRLSVLYGERGYVSSQTRRIQDNENERAEYQERLTENVKLVDSLTSQIEDLQGELDKVNTKLNI